MYHSINCIHSKIQQRYIERRKKRYVYVLIVSRVSNVFVQKYKKDRKKKKKKKKNIVDTVIFIQKYEKNI